MAHNNHLGITGTRQGLTRAQYCQLFYQMERFIDKHVGLATFHHGDCIGADAQAHSIAVGLRYAIEIHPPEIKLNRAFCDSRVWMPQNFLVNLTVWPAKDYLARNEDIVDGSSLLLATPKSMHEEMRGSGTWHAIRYARKIGRSYLIIWPNGQTSDETDML